MSDKSDDNKSQSRANKSAKDAFTPKKGQSAQAPSGEEGKRALFTEEEMDIYCNKINKETYIFHSKEVDYKALKEMIYDPEEFTVDVVLKDGSVIDLGVKIKWLIRPYFSKAEEVQIVRTKNGEAIDGHFVPLRHKGS